MDLTRAHRGFAGYDWASSGYVTVVPRSTGHEHLGRPRHDDPEAVRSISRQTQKGRPGTGRP
jgi:hypothetical protein